MQHLTATFDRTLNALNDGLRVEHIATDDIRTCLPEQRAADVLADSHLGGFDQIPVRKGGAIVGVLERSCRDDDASVEAAMRPLDESLLVAGNQPLGAFLPRIVDREYQLVLVGSAIEGIVTRSDMLKLPVRLYAFTLITNLEMVMAAAIRDAFGEREGDPWIEFLSPDRRNMVLAKQCELRAKRLDPSLVEFTEFCDKITVLKKHHGLTKRQVSELGRVERLRNQIAHAAVFAEDRQSLRDFVTTLARARYWSREIPNLGGTNETGELPRPDSLRTPSNRA